MPEDREETTVAAQLQSLLSGLSETIAVESKEKQQRLLNLLMQWGSATTREQPRQRCNIPVGLEVGPGVWDRAFRDFTYFPAKSRRHLDVCV